MNSFEDGLVLIGGGGGFFLGPSPCFHSVVLDSFFKIISSQNVPSCYILQCRVSCAQGCRCHADHVEISHVLKAMQVPEAWAKGTLRFSTGKYTTADEIDRALEVIVAVVKRLRR